MINETIEDFDIQQMTGENPYGNVSVDVRVIEYTKRQRNKLLAIRYLENSLNSSASVCYDIKLLFLFIGGFIIWNKYKRFRRRRFRKSEYIKSVNSSFRTKDIKFRE